MAYILVTFKAVSTIFACLAVATGTQALWDPIGFAASFGIPIPTEPASRRDVGSAPDMAQKCKNCGNPPAATLPYVSLMGVRQLATGLTLAAFAWQGKWEEMATLLFILGFVVARTDGRFLYRSGEMSKGLFHAGPGAAIALLAGAVVFSRS